MLVIFLARDGRLRAGWRFFLGVVAVFAAEFGSGYLVSFILGGGSPTLFVFLQEPTSLVLALLMFSVLLTMRKTRLASRFSASSRKAWPAGFPKIT